MLNGAMSEDVPNGCGFATATPVEEWARLTGGDVLATSLGPRQPG